MSLVANNTLLIIFKTEVSVFQQTILSSSLTYYNVHFGVRVEAFAGKIWI